MRRQHYHYSSDSKQTTARKCLLNFLISLGIKSAQPRGISVNFAGQNIRIPGAYGNVVLQQS